MQSFKNMGWALLTGNFQNRQLVTERYCGNSHETITLQEGSTL